MQGKRRWWTALGAVAALVVLGAAAVAAWVPSDAQLAQRVAARASATLGVPVSVGDLHWRLLPRPQLVLENLRADAGVAGVPAASIGRLSADLDLPALLQRRIAIARLQLDDATLPQPLLSGLKLPPQDAAPAGVGPLQVAGIPIERAEWRNLRWVSVPGKALAYAGEVDFDAHWRPRRATLVRSGAPTDTQLLITRQGQDDRWQLELHAGGRRETGTLALQTQGSDYAVTGSLDFQNVDLVQLLAAFERESAVAGQASGHAELDARGADAAALLRSAHTRTSFTLAPATLLKFDLAAAVKSAGMHRGGTTALDRLSGIVETQNDRAGLVVRYSDLKARSGVLSATGDAVLQSRRVQGHVAVDLVNGVVGLPLQFGGTLDDPTLSLSAAALTGAAVGTAVLPGVGTAIGARVGDTIRQIFGKEPEKPAR
ncbi:AsmA-like C-terminal region-containing protein [Xylophilus sp. GW821-FHT01B05]